MQRSTYFVHPSHEHHITMHLTIPTTPLLVRHCGTDATPDVKVLLCKTHRRS